MEEHAVQILKNLQGTPLKIDVVLLQEELTLEQLMTLSPGGILNFQCSVKTPAYLSVNGKKFAKGRVVQSGEYYGLQLDEVIPS